MHNLEPLLSGGARKLGVVRNEGLGIVSQGQSRCKVDGIERAKVRIAQSGSRQEDRLINPDEYEAGQNRLSSSSLRRTRARPSERSVHFHASDD